MKACLTLQRHHTNGEHLAFALSNLAPIGWIYSFLPIITGQERDEHKDVTWIFRGETTGPAGSGLIKLPTAPVLRVRDILIDDLCVHVGLHPPGAVALRVISFGQKSGPEVNTMLARINSKDCSCYIPVVNHLANALTAALLPLYTAWFFTLFA